MTAGVLLIVLVPAALTLRLAFRAAAWTSLKHALWWWVAGLAVLAAAAMLLTDSDRAGLCDQLWYFASVLLLCPFVAALGARRPGAGAWLFFVVLPLILVLEWPAISLLFTAEINEPLLLQTPAVIGVFLVLFMGCGNYVGTRFTVSVVFFAISEVCFVISVCEMRPEWLEAASLRYFGCLMFGACCVVSSWKLSRWETATMGVSRVWSDFRDSFGTVWSRRVAERFNLMAKREKLNLRIVDSGPSRQSESEIPSTACVQREEEILRWILKRFVDPPWLDSRLTTHAVPSSVQNPDVNDASTI